MLFLFDFPKQFFQSAKYFSVAFDTIHHCIFLDHLTGLEWEDTILRLFWSYLESRFQNVVLLLIPLAFSLWGPAKFHLVPYSFQHLYETAG